MGNFSSDDIIVDISGNIGITISCSNFAYDYLNSAEVRTDILAFVQGFFFEPVYIELVRKDSEVQLVEEMDVLPVEMFALEDEKPEKTIKHLKVKLTEDYESKGINGNPISIDSLDASMGVTEIAGEVLFVTEKSFESKRKDKEGNAVVKQYYSFTLKDSSGKINCVYFPTKDCVDKVKEVLVEHKTMILSGTPEEFHDKMNFKVKYLGSCEIIPEDVVEETISEVEFKKEPNKDYLYVKPEPYIELMQDNFFAVKEEVGEYLLKNDVVVFDIETTGLDPLNCEIIEIGAVKIKGGRIAETFETLIKPKVSIPDEIVELTGITDDMVKDAPNIKQVLPDFYKFCYGTTIMAYNIDFDYRFINIAGIKQCYNFDMRQIDAMYLARAFIPGLKNFKLGTVCKKLGVSLENAHRAVHDATATAEVVIKLSPNIT